MARRVHCVRDMRSFLLLSALVTSACMNHDGLSTSQSAISGEDYFTQSVFPMLESTCGACHSVGTGQPNTGLQFIVEGDPHATYVLMTTNPAITGNFDTNAPIVTKGLHEGPTFNVVDESTIVEWLTEEHDERF